jgi:hypothetical protein
VVAHIHGGEHGQQEKPNPQPVQAAEHVRLRAHQQRERLAMAELVIAPVLEPQKDRVDQPVRVAL